MATLEELRERWAKKDASVLQMVRASNQVANPFEASRRRPREELKLTELRLPLSSLPSGVGRGRTFELRKVPARVIQLAETLLMAVNTDAKSMTSLYECFLKFKEINGLEEKDDIALLLFLLDIVAQGIKITSAITYGRTIISALGRANRPIVSPLVRDTFNVLELIAAEEESDHALDISEDAAWEIVRQLRGELRLIGFLMLATGIRCHDQEHMLSSDLEFRADGRLLVYFRYTKNHRTRKERYSITTRPKHLVPELLEVRGRARVMPRIVPVSELNAALERCMTGVTSYSLRRRFIHTVLENSTTGDVVDWVAAQKLTGHKDLEVLRNSYAPKFSNNL